MGRASLLHWWGVLGLRAMASSACYGCGEVGHIQRDCPQRKPTAGPASSGAAAAAPEPYVEKRKAVRKPWPASAPLAQLQHATNMTDVETLFSIIQDETVRAALIHLSAEQLKESRMVKEVYLPLGRKMELVTCEFDGGRTAIQESENIMEPEHLAVFTAQCVLLSLWAARSSLCVC